QSEATMDFKNDGKADLVWHGSDGGVFVFVMDATYITSMVRAVFNLTGAPGAEGNAHVEAAGDFNTDCKGDLIWRNPSTGVVVLWLMDGGTLVSSATLGTVDLSYRIEGPR